MSTGARYTLRRDYRGVFGDALLYVPTVTALAAFAVASWYDNKISIAYLLGFLACFFLFAGANRILTTRLMWLPSAPVAIEIRSNAVDLILKSGAILTLERDVKLYRDRSGRSFGLTGLNERGRRCQFVLQRGQFSQDSDFQAVMNNLERSQSGRA